MSDWLVQMQNWMAQYPTWMVAGVIGFAVVVVAILAWKALRIVMAALIVAALLAGGWYVWTLVSDHRADRPASSLSAPAIPGAPLAG